MKIKTYKGDKLNDAIKICLESKLHEPRWTFEITFKAAIKTVEYIRIANIDGNPVGCFVKFKITDIYGQCNCGTYVKPEYRRRKIGSKLIPRFGRKNLQAAEGIEGSKTFYAKNKLQIS